MQEGKHSHAMHRRGGTNEKSLRGQNSPRPSKMEKVDVQNDPQKMKPGANCPSPLHGKAGARGMLIGWDTFASSSVTGSVRSKKGFGGILGRRPTALRVAVGDGGLATAILLRCDCATGWERGNSHRLHNTYTHTRARAQQPGPNNPLAAWTMAQA